MTKLFSGISALLVMVIMAFGSSFTALAAESTVTFLGGNQGFDLQPGSEYTASDLFEGFKKIMPGDSLKEVITVTNRAADCDYIKVYMRALVHDEAKNPISPGVVSAGETASAMSDFLSQLSMKVYRGTDLIYEASAEELDGFKNQVLLGTLRNGNSVTLTVELIVPIELGNEYANRIGEVDWVFTAEGFDDSDPQEPDRSDEPLDHQVSKSPQVPKTGDASNPVLYLTLMGIAGCALVGLVVFRRRYNQT